MRVTRSSLSSGNLAELNPLQKGLLDQFKNTHDDTLKRSFLEDTERTGTYAYEQGGERPKQFVTGGVQPVLWYNQEELEGHAVSLQKWEGIVVEVGKEVFYARLYDLTSENPEEEAEFSIDEVSEEDRELLKAGAVFYWSIGYFTTRTGQRLRTSIIKFRRLPAWTEREIKAAKERAIELRRIIGLEVEKTTSRVKESFHETDKKTDKTDDRWLWK